MDREVHTDRDAGTTTADHPRPPQESHLKSGPRFTLVTRMAVSAFLVFPQRSPAAVATILTSASGSNGLPTCASNPAAWHRRRSSAEA